MENPIVETGGDQLDYHRIGGPVFPKPTMDTDGWRDKGSVALIFPYLIVDVICLVVVGSFFAGRSDIRIAMKLEEHPIRGSPRVKQACTLLHVVLVLTPADLEPGIGVARIIIPAALIIRNAKVSGPSMSLRQL